MIQPAGLVYRLGGEIDAQFLEDAHVNRRENDRGVGLAVPQLIQFFQCQSGNRVGNGAERQGQQYLIGVQAGVMAAEVVDLQRLNRGL